MNNLFRGANELKIGSSILTRRGGTDANAPESPRKAILRDWHVGNLTPQILEKNEKCPLNHFNANSKYSVAHFNEQLELEMFSNSCQGKLDMFPN